MIVDQDRNFLTQRTTPELGLIEAFRSGEQISLRMGNEEQLAVSIPNDGDRVPVTVWGDQVDAIAIPIADAWLEKRLGLTAQLVVMPESTLRETSIGGIVSFADGYPYLITNTASRDDLNARIDGDPIEMAAFRPNLVLETDQPWIEDSWRRIGVGDAVFELISPCVRCKVTTLDPEDPTRVNPHQEPLRTLSEFRRDDVRGGVTFGWNAMCLTPGVEIHVGDTVSPLESATKH